MDIVVINISDKESAKSILKSELGRRDISYQKLAELMALKGWKLSKASIDNKMARGTFGADFFVDALKTIGCTHIGVVKPNKDIDELF